jgi:phosphatidate cytidylyltransferase
MKRVATAAVLIPIVLWAVFRAPPWLFLTIILLVALLSIREFLKIAEAHGFEPSWAAAFIVCTLCFLGLRDLGWPAPAYPLLVAALLIFAGPLFLALGTRAADLAKSLPSAAVSLLALAYIAFPLAFLVLVREQPWGKFLLFYLLLVVWAGDTFAYYAGRAFGRHKLAPRISPGKTWEGTVASLVGSAIVGTLLFAFAQDIAGFLFRIHLLRPEDGIPNPATLSPPIWNAALLTIAINIAAQVGDLAESAIKRGANLKDSGSILPGHGGMLDRIDALLFAAPVLCYYALTILLL